MFCRREPLACGICGAAGQGLLLVIEMHSVQGVRCVCLGILDCILSSIRGRLGIWLLKNSLFMPMDPTQVRCSYHPQNSYDDV